MAKPCVPASDLPAADLSATARPAAASPAAACPAAAGDGQKSAPAAAPAPAPAPARDLAADWPDFVCAPDDDRDPRLAGVGLWLVALAGWMAAAALIAWATSEWWQ